MSAPILPKLANCAADPLSDLIIEMLAMDDAGRSRVFYHIDYVLEQRAYDGSAYSRDIYLLLGLDDHILSLVLPFMQDSDLLKCKDFAATLECLRPTVPGGHPGGTGAGIGATASPQVDLRDQVGYAHPSPSAAQEGFFQDPQSLLHLGPNFSAGEERFHGLPQSHAALPYHSATPTITKDVLKTLVQEKGSGYKGYIKSFAQSQQVRAEYLLLNYKPARVGTAGDFPRDEAGQLELVRRLYQAITNVDNVIDGSRIKRTKRKRDAAEDEDVEFVDSAAVQAIKAQSPVEVELLAWDILRTLKEFQEGRVSIPHWGKDWHWKEYPTFMDRFNAAVASLTASKTTVKSLLGVSFNERLAADPARELKRKIENKDINMKRDYQVKAGNHAIHSGKVILNQDYSLLDADGKKIAPGNPRGCRDSEDLAAPLKKRLRTDNRRAAAPAAPHRSAAVPPKAEPEELLRALAGAAVTPKAAFSPAPAQLPQEEPGTAAPPASFTSVYGALESQYRSFEAPGAPAPGPSAAFQVHEPHQEVTSPNDAPGWDASGMDELKDEELDFFSGLPDIQRSGFQDDGGFLAYEDINIDEELDNLF